MANDAEFRFQAAQAALEYVQDARTVGVGTGRTSNAFIELLADHPHRIEACVASSLETARQLKAKGFVVLDLPLVDHIEIYFDGADEVDHQHRMIKGGGGALTREKIIASAADIFICMIEEKKWVTQLGKFPVAVEVLPLARSTVARALVALGGDPVYRQGFVTDNGNIILDLYNVNPTDLLEFERAIKLLPGVVENGLFIQRRANRVIKAGPNGVTTSF